MSLAHQMVEVAAGCLDQPTKPSIMSKDGKYICVDDPRSRQIPAGAPVIDPVFKLVFLTAAGGTLFFFIVCVTISIFHNQEHDLLGKVVMTVLSLVKIGFGAVVGVLGGKALSDRPRKKVGAKSQA